MRFNGNGICVVCFCGGVTGSLLAQESQPRAADNPPPPVAEESVPPEAKAPAAAPLPGPKYNNLRYNEDFRYLDGDPESYRKDFGSCAQAGVRGVDYFHESG